MADWKTTSYAYRYCPPPAITGYDIPGVNGKYEEYQSPITTGVNGKYEDYEFPPITSVVDFKRKLPLKPAASDVDGKRRLMSIPPEPPMTTNKGMLEGLLEGKHKRQQHLRAGDSFGTIDYLFPSGLQDYLIRNDTTGNQVRLTADCLKDKRYVVISTFYLPIGYESICYELQSIFSELAKEKHDFTVVLVALMRSPVYDDNDQLQLAFTSFFSAFSPLFLAVPTLNDPRSLSLFQATSSLQTGQNSCIVVDLKTNQVLHNGLDAFFNFGPDFYPFTSKRYRELVDQAIRIRGGGGVNLAEFLCCRSSDVLGCSMYHSESHCGKKVSLSSLAENTVWLYYLCNGDFVSQLRCLWEYFKRKGHNFEVVVVHKKLYDPKSDALVYSLLQKFGCCGWFHLPLNEVRVSHRLYSLCNLSSVDKLVVVGPNGSFVEPDAKEVCLDYGVGAYPFTKQTVWDNEVKRVRGLTVQEWLKRCGIHSLRRDGISYPLSVVQEMNILVYVGLFSSSATKLGMEGELLEWAKQMQADPDPKRSCYVMFLCKNKAADVFSLEEFCSKMEWFLPDPFQYEINKALDELLYNKFRPSWSDSLAAFGSNGRLLRLFLEKSLRKHPESVTFPQTEDLCIDVKELLSGQPDDPVWYRAFSGQSTLSI